MSDFDGAHHRQDPPTSSGLGPACPEKTRSDLAWDSLLAAIADRCQGVMGKRSVRSLSFASTRDEVRSRLSEAREAYECLQQGEPLPVEALDDVDESVSRLRVGGVLSPRELRTLATMLSAASKLRRFLGRRRSLVPTLLAACSTDPTLDGVGDEVTAAFDADGTLSDSASPELARLRGEQRAARTRILSRLDDLMQRYERVLQERFVTEREGRYVLPVRSDSHERFPGLVHATSASGSTIFVEPRAVIPMGNRLKMLDAEVERQEQLVYARLSGLLGDHLASIEAAREALERADRLSAVARLTRELDLTFPTLVDEPRLELEGARHPLLLLELPEGSVVASDLAIRAGKAMVVSGPNAGGKTVALKTMGLAALMTRAGFPLPCRSGSVMGIFDAVLTDVGDDQNLSKNLSTFSAHVSNLRRILEETSRGSLVLLDELAGGTDPREGEALAAGVLDSLCARGGAVVVTTHYEGLKALALGDDRFENASVGFDEQTIRPTFVLTPKIPGSSSALAIARRFGMPSTVIERASRFLSRDDQSFETSVKKLHEERAALELARAAAIQREHEADEARRALQAETNRLRERDERTLSREAEALLASLRRARDDLRDAQARLRNKKLDEARLKEAERTIDRVSSQVALGGALEPALRPDRGSSERRPLSSHELRTGLRVYVPRLRAEAEIVSVSGTSVRIAAGALKLTVSATELFRVVEEPPPPSKARGASAREGRDERAAERSKSEPVIVTKDNTCDVRGLRVDDALSLATSFLDRCLNERRPYAVVLHGTGTGALRDAVRKELKSSPYVAHLRPALPDEGGDGFTVFWLS